MDWDNRRIVYYDAHCSGCGRKTTADLLAFDFGPLISNAITIMAERQFGKDETWIDLLKLDFGLYYTWRKLSERFGLKNGVFCPFRFTVGKLKEQIATIADCSIDEIMSMQDRNNLRFNNLIRKVKAPIEKGKRATRQQVDPDDVWTVIKTLQHCKNDEDVIAEFKVKVILADDDNGNPFPKNLMIEYEDGKTQTVIKNVCPYCGKSFYAEVGKHKEFIICMAGSARVGKTAYLAALVDSIYKNGNSAVRNNSDGTFLTVVPSDDPEWEFFEENILRAYQEGRKIPKTAFEGNGETIPLFSLEIEVNVAEPRRYIFTFIDMPGEAYDDGTGSDSEAGVNFIMNDRRVVQHASMFWFCVDPSQIDASIAALQKVTTMEQDQVNTNTKKVMGNIRKTMAAVNVDGNLKDAAVLITKSDIITLHNELQLFQPGTNVVANYTHEGSGTSFGKLVLDYEKAMDFVRNSGAYVGTTNDITVTLKEMFKRFAPFAVAAYGQDIKDDPIIDFPMDFGDLLGGSATSAEQFTAKPSMVELPFLWSLSVLGILPATHMVVKYIKRKPPFLPWAKEIMVPLPPVEEEVSIEELFRRK